MLRAGIRTRLRWSSGIRRNRPALPCDFQRVAISRLASRRRSATTLHHYSPTVNGAELKTKAARTVQSSRRKSLSNCLLAFSFGGAGFARPLSGSGVPAHGGLRVELTGVPQNTLDGRTMRLSDSAVNTAPASRLHTAVA